MPDKLDGCVIALTGSFASGCTTVAKSLEAAGFFRYRLSEPITNVARDKGIDRLKDRGALQDIGNEMRKRDGLDVLARTAIERLAEYRDKPVVIDGIRNVAEIRRLRTNLPRVFVVAVAASYDERWRRVKDHFDLNQATFDEVDRRDQQERDPWGQHVEACVAEADYAFQNDVHLNLGGPRDGDTFDNRVRQVAELIRVPGSRSPSPMELNMVYAAHASLRSSCLKRGVGAVVADEHETVLSVGFNEVPRGDEPCSQVYGECYRATARRERRVTCPACGIEVDKCACPECGADWAFENVAGKELDLCRALHAEENAILQLARNGGFDGGGSIYTTTFPCLLCAKKIVAVGIKRVVYIDPYPIREARELLEQHRVKLEPFEGVRARAFHKLFTTAQA